MRDIFRGAGGTYWSRFHPNWSMLTGRNNCSNTQLHWNPLKLIRMKISSQNQNTWSWFEYDPIQPNQHNDQSGSSIHYTSIWFRIYIGGVGGVTTPPPFSISFVLYGHGEFIFLRDWLNHVSYWDGGNHPTPCNQLNAVIYGLGWIYFRQSY